MRQDTGQQQPGSSFRELNWCHLLGFTVSEAPLSFMLIIKAGAGFECKPKQRVRGR